MEKREKEEKMKAKFLSITLKKDINPTGVESYIKTEEIKALFFAQNSWNVLVSDSVFSIEEYSARDIKKIIDKISDDDDRLSLSKE